MEYGPDKAVVRRTDRGCAVKFKIQDPSSSDQYAIFVKTEGETEDKQLAVAPGMSNNLQSEVDSEFLFEITILLARYEDLSAPWLFFRTVAFSRSCQV